MLAVACDVTDEASLERVIALIVDRYGRLDGAFHNAGLGGTRLPSHEITAEAFDRGIATNLRGPFLCMKHEIPVMLAGGGGSIVNTSSVGGIVGSTRNADYAAAKFGLTGVGALCGAGYARDGVRANAIAGPHTIGDV